MKVEFPNVNNKLAFFDYDRTLVAHTHSREFMAARKDDYMMECLYMLTALEEEHASDRPLPCMQWFLKKLHEDGYGIYVLTHEPFNLRNNLKQRQLEEFFPGIPIAYLTVDSPEHKVDMMRAVAVAECCSLSDIIFVDDQMATVSAAVRAGIDGRHLSDIVVLYECGQAEEEQEMFLKPGGGTGCTVVEPVLTAEYAERDTGGTERTEDVHRDHRLLAERNGRGRLTDAAVDEIYGDCLKLVENNGSVLGI